MLVNSAFGHTPLSSPLESPDVMQMLLPMQDLRATHTNSMASIKLSSVDSLQPAKPPTSILNQVRPPNRVASSNSCSSSTTTTTATTNNHTYSHHPTTSVIGLGQPPLPASQSHTPRSIHYYLQKNSISSQNTASAAGASGKSLCSIPETDISPDCSMAGMRRQPPPPLEFSLSSVGRSFFESSEDGKGLVLLQTPDTPSANITPSSSSNRFSDKSFTDSRTHEYYLEMGDDEHEFEANKNNLKMMFDMKSKMRQESYCGSWDLLEIDLDFHEVNLDPSFGGDVQEYVFMGEDDPYGVLPPQPTQPDTLQL